MHTSTQEKPKIIVVVGPTASGKSDLAVSIAKSVGGEVISADSRQVFRGLDIGTGKITKREMRGVPHHLLDVASARRIYSAAEFQKDGTKALGDIVSRGKVPIICGGTGYYIRALVESLDLPNVPPNPVLRKKIEGKSTEQLHALLRKLDPSFSKIIDKHNPRRLVRAIEIATALGKVPPLATSSPYNTLYIGIDVDIETLRERIHLRLTKRMRAGMLAEASDLHKRGLSWARMDDLGLEYRYLSRFLLGKISKDEMLSQLESETIKYAKRQKTWFKTNKNIHWFTYDKFSEIKNLCSDFLLPENYTKTIKT